jgi:hypothetical protein
MLYREGRDIPFYLLHILELANLDYEIVDASVDPSPAEGSLLVLHSRESHTSAITQHVSSGLYTADGTFVAQQLQLDVDIAEPQVLVQQYTHPGVRIRPGGRLATAFLNSPVLDEADNLNKQTEQLVQSLLSRIKLSKVES